MCKRSSLFAILAVAVGLAGSVSANAQSFGPVRSDLTILKTQKSMVQKAPLGSVYSTKVCMIPARPPMSYTKRSCPMPNSAPVGVVCYCPGIDKEDGVIQNGSPIATAH